jgi:hypothetical protein
MPNPWVSLRCGQLILVNKKEQLEKGGKKREKNKEKNEEYVSL